MVSLELQIYLPAKFTFILRGIEAVFKTLQISYMYFSPFKTKNPIAL